MADLKEYQLFTSPVWTYEKEIDAVTLDLLTKFAYDTVDQYPMEQPVSKRNGRNSLWINTPNPALMEILQESIANIKGAYQPTVGLTLKNYWVNINPPGAYNVRHNHPNTVLACTLYLQTPKDSGDFVVYNPNPASVFASYSDKRDHYNFSEFRITPTPGMFLAVPGWLDHSVDINTSDTDRISISMNLIATK